MSAGQSEYLWPGETKVLTKEFILFSLLTCVPEVRCEQLYSLNTDHFSSSSVWR